MYKNLKECNLTLSVLEDDHAALMGFRKKAKDSLGDLKMSDLLDLM